MQDEQRVDEQAESKKKPQPQQPNNAEVGKKITEALRSFEGRISKLEQAVSANGKANATALEQIREVVDTQDDRVGVLASEVLAFKGELQKAVENVGAGPAEVKEAAKRVQEIAEKQVGIAKNLVNRHRRPILSGTAAVVIMVLTVVVTLQAVWIWKGNADDSCVEIAAGDGD